MIPAIAPSSSIAKTAVFPSSLQILIDRIHRQARLTPEIIGDCILEARVSPTDLMPGADFEHPVEDSYGRKLVYGNDFI
ncbi:MAG: hypothetical protein AAGA60_17820 [Cyanobacteria bacterium P01_E01_bin.42]